MNEVVMAKEGSWGPSGLWRSTVGGDRVSRGETTVEICTPSGIPPDHKLLLAFSQPFLASVSQPLTSSLQFHPLGFIVRYL